MPIEQIKVGDWVLPKPEHGGEQAYKRVLAAFKHEPQRVIEVTCCVPGDRSRGKRIITTLEQSFWVVDHGWTTAIESGSRGENSQFELANSSHEYIFGTTVIYATEQPGVGWSSYHCDDPSTEGWMWDYTNHQFVAQDIFAIDAVRNFAMDNPYLHLPVYSLELDDHHTYYVGELGVRVAASI